MSDSVPAVSPTATSVHLVSAKPPITIGAIQCRDFAEADSGAWDAFVTRHPCSAPFHLIAWKKTIEESFPYRPVYLLATSGQEIHGVLPMFLVRNPIIGKVLISSPFAVYGGILADSAEAQRALYDRARSIGENLGVEYIEFRNSWISQCVGEPNVSRYVAFKKDLPRDEEELLASLPKKTRNMVRKAAKTAFTSRRVRATGTLYSVMSRNMRRLGTPNFPRKYFDRLLANFGDMADIWELWLDGRAMAVSLNFYFHGEMHTYHAAADSRFNALAPNTFMYFDHLRQAVQERLTTFDFGRCKRGTTVFEFKKHWGTTMRELPYEIVLVRRKALPDFSPANPSFRALIQIWRRLPLPATRALSTIFFPLFP
jgi:FemAB-related protein (PEP-CTERM system-associated)